MQSGAWAKYGGDIRDARVRHDSLGSMAFQAWQALTLHTTRQRDASKEPSEELHCRFHLPDSASSGVKPPVSPSTPRLLHHVDTLFHGRDVEEHRRYNTVNSQDSFQCQERAQRRAIKYTCKGPAPLVLSSGFNATGTYTMGLKESKGHC